MLKIGLCRQRGLVNANDSHLQRTWAKVYTNFKSKPFDSQILKNSFRVSKYFQCTVKQTIRAKLRKLVIDSLPY